MGKRGDVIKNKRYHVWNLENRLRVEQDEEAYRDMKRKRRDERVAENSKRRKEMLKGGAEVDMVEGESTDTEEAGYAYVGKWKKRMTREEKIQKRETAEHENREAAFKAYNTVHEGIPPPREEPRDDNTPECNEMQPEILPADLKAMLFPEGDSKLAPKDTTTPKHIERTHHSMHNRIVEREVAEMDRTHAFGGKHGVTDKPWYMNVATPAKVEVEKVREKPKKEKKEKKAKENKEDKYERLRAEREKREAVEKARARQVG